MQSLNRSTINNKQKSNKGFVGIENHIYILMSKIEYQNELVNSMGWGGQEECGVSGFYVDYVGSKDELYHNMTCATK